MTLLQLRIEFNHCFADSFSISEWLEVNTLDNHRCGIGQLNVLLAASLARKLTISFTLPNIGNSESSRAHIPKTGHFTW
jgi:hypothetical protein